MEPKQERKPERPAWNDINPDGHRWDEGGLYGAERTWRDGPPDDDEDE